MDQQISHEHISELSVETLQRLEAAQVGSPLAHYIMRPQFVRAYKRIVLLKLIPAFILLLVGLIFFLVTLYQLLVLSNQHPTDFYGMIQQQERISDMQNQLIERLIPLVLGFIYTVGALVIRRMVTRMLPATIVICTDALVLVRPAKIEVARWSEITRIVNTPRKKEKKHYRVYRIKDDPISFGEKSHENVDDLLDQIRLRHPLT